MRHTHKQPYYVDPGWISPLPWDFPFVNLRWISSLPDLSGLWGFVFFALWIFLGGFLYLLLFSLWSFWLRALGFFFFGNGRSILWRFGRRLMDLEGVVGGNKGVLLVRGGDGLVGGCSAVSTRDLVWLGSVLVLIPPVVVLLLC